MTEDTSPNITLPASMVQTAQSAPPTKPQPTAWSLELEQLRNTAQLSKAATARLCKVSEQTYRNWESGVSTPHRGKQIQVRNVLVKAGKEKQHNAAVAVAQELRQVSNSLTAPERAALHNVGIEMISGAQSGVEEPRSVKSISFVQAVPLTNKELAALLRAHADSNDKVAEVLGGAEEGAAFSGLLREAAGRLEQISAPAIDKPDPIRTVTTTTPPPEPTRPTKPGSQVFQGESPMLSVSEIEAELVEFRE